MNIFVGRNEVERREFSSLDYNLADLHVNNIVLFSPRSREAKLYRWVKVGIKLRLEIVFKEPVNTEVTFSSLEKNLHKPKSHLNRFK